MAWWDFDNAAAARQEVVTDSLGRMAHPDCWALVSCQFSFLAPCGRRWLASSCFPADRIDGAINPAIK